MREQLGEVIVNADAVGIEADLARLGSRG